MSLALGYFLSALLAASALHKMVSRDRLAPAAARLTRTSAALGLPVLLAAASIEAILCLMLLTADLRTAGALGAATLWVIYAVTLSSRRGEVLDCGCDLNPREKPVDLFAISRPFVLAALAIVVALIPPAPFAPDAPFAAIALLALWFAAGELAALPHLAKVSRR